MPNYWFISYRRALKAAIWSTDCTGRGLAWIDCCNASLSSTWNRNGNNDPLNGKQRRRTAAAYTTEAKMHSVDFEQHYLHLHCFSEPGMNGMRLHLFQFANADNTSAAVQSGQPISILLLNTDITEHYRLLSACEISRAVLIFYSYTQGLWRLQEIKLINWVILKSSPQWNHSALTSWAHLSVNSRAALGERGSLPFVHEGYRVLLSAVIF